MEAISYKLPDFEGPLDLLLFLVQKNKLNILDISKHKLNINDIEISALLEQYLDYIEQMRVADLEVASEFLEMAARLVQIKSSMLLPRHEEAEALRQELVGELIEYQLCQEAAGRLARLHIGGDLFIREPQEIEPDRTYRRRHPPEALLDAYLAAAGRGKRRLPPPAQAFSGIVSRKIVSVAAKIFGVMRRLARKKAVAYDDLFAGARSKSELVATFLAVLELYKRSMVRVEQSQLFGDIDIEYIEDSGELLLDGDDALTSVGEE